MGNETMINRDVNASATQINNAAVNSSSSSNTIVNSALYSLSQIPVGTILCDKYKVISEMNIMSGEASLFICEYHGEKYVAKLYRRDVAIKDDVTNALKNISSPHVAKLFDTGVYNGFPFEIIPFYAQGSLQGRTFSFDELKQRIIPSLNEGLHVLHENGIMHLDWNSLSSDAAGAKTKEALLQNVKDTMGEKDSVVILMHDSSDKILTYEMLSDLISYLREQGYKFENIYDLLD